MSLSYEASGVRYEPLDAFKRACQRAARGTVDLLEKHGYPGEGVGERLRSATFATLQDAWEAHKVRNQIAHEGSAFNLSADLVRRTIGRYENVFHEFKVI